MVPLFFMISFTGLGLDMTMMIPAIILIGILNGLIYALFTHLTIKLIIKILNGNLRLILERQRK